MPMANQRRQHDALRRAAGAPRQGSQVRGEWFVSAGAWAPHTKDQRDYADLVGPGCGILKKRVRIYNRTKYYLDYSYY